MESVSDRHSGDLGGVLDAFDPTAAITVSVEIDPENAASPAAQHAAWMAINLLVRAEGIVSRVLVTGPSGVRVCNQVVPFGLSRDLVERLVEAGADIDVVPVVRSDEEAGDRRLLIGSNAPGVLTANTLALTGSGWWGGVAQGVVPPTWQSADMRRDEPIGPYVAACLAVGEVFLGVRAPKLATDRPASWGWNAWSRAVAGAPVDAGPVWGDLDLTDIGLAGVGAVGAAWMHALWAAPRVRGSAIVADADGEGVSLSNLNRGLLFRRTDVGRPKATVAADVARGPINLEPFNDRFETQASRPGLLVSAVDTNTARDALQGLYPARILSGSTRDLRAEVMVVGTPGVGACLRCYNPPERETSDAELHARARRDGEPLLKDLAQEFGTEVDAIDARLRPGACDALSDRLMERLRNRLGDSAPPRFAVGFSSAMSGTLLAAETLREVFRSTPTTDGPSTRINFQFQHPEGGVNGARPYPRDIHCPCCQPDTEAVRIWRTRRDAYGGGTPSVGA